MRGVKGQLLHCDTIIINKVFIDCQQGQELLLVASFFYEELTENLQSNKNVSLSSN